MDLKDITASPTDVYWCVEHSSYCVVLGFCEWDGACIIIELHDDEDTTGELRTTESDQLWPDPIAALKAKEELEHFHRARVLTIEGHIGDGRINDITSEDKWAKNPAQEIFGEMAFEYGKAIAHKIALAVDDVINGTEEQEISGEIDGIDCSVNISCVEAEAGFSHAGCEACNTGLGNSVTEHVGTHKDGEKFTYAICGDCTYKHEYGWN